MHLFELALSFALLVPLALIPPALFVISVAAFALAPFPPKRAAQNLGAAWKMFGAALLPAPLLVLLEYSVNSVCDTDRFVDPGLDAVFLAILAVLVVGTPVVLGRWFRRIAPARSVGVLFTVVTASVGAWVAALDVLNRIGRGFHDF